MSYKQICSLQNDEIKDLVRLRQRRNRDQQQLAILEEPLVISRALDAGHPVDTVYFCPELISAEDQPLLQRLEKLKSAHYRELTINVMTKAAYREKSAGFLVIINQNKPSLADLPLNSPAGQPALLVVLEAVEKPGNLGAVLRIADGAQVQGVILCGEGTDVYNPNVLRASRGAFFSVPTVVADTAEVLQYMDNNGITTIATSPDATTSWQAANLTGPVAIVLGTEHNGLSHQWLSVANTTVSIPMLGTGDSLNVATSAAILLYEAVRQRQKES